MNESERPVYTTELFSGLSGETAAAAMEGLPCRLLERDDEFGVADTDSPCCVVRSGRIALEFHGDERRHTIGLLEEGDLLVRPVDPWATAGPQVRCRAIEASEIVLVGRPRLERWMHHPALAANMVRVLSAQVADRELAVAIALEPRVERRLLLKLRQLAERWGKVTPDGVRLDLRLTHQELASMVGAVRESVTIALGRLAEAGEIEVRNRTLIIRDPTRDSDRTLA